VAKGKFELFTRGVLCSTERNYPHNFMRNVTTYEGVSKSTRIESITK